jgi:hypothetical protein
VGRPPTSPGPRSGAGEPAADRCRHHDVAHTGPPPRAAALDPPGAVASRRCRNDPFAAQEPLFASAVAASRQGRVALGLRAGQPVRRLRSAATATSTGRRSARLEGFSLHADVAVPARRRDQLEKVCRYILRPPLALERLTAVPPGPWTDGSSRWSCWSGWPPSSRRPGDRCSPITGCWRRDPDGEPRLSRRPPLRPRGRTRRRASRGGGPGRGCSSGVRG